MRRRPDWQLYERLIAGLMVRESSTDVCVTPNAKVRGRISGTLRQIDVLIDARHDTDNSRRVIVDAKRQRRKIDIKHVEEFEGMMKDVGATHGYLVAPSGRTKAAVRRAQQAITISLVPLEHVDQIDPMTWPACMGKKCPNGRVFWDGFPELSMDLVPTSTSTSDPLLRHSWVHYVGKCDVCGRFHVRCLTCGETLSFDDDLGEHQCACKMPWFWIASIETDEAQEASAELRVVNILTGGYQCVDRRPHSGTKAARKR